jgi:competence ComEA-like helix-hairpin-helix protein
MERRMRSDASYAALGLLVAWLAIAALASGEATSVQQHEQPAVHTRPQQAPSAANLRALRDGKPIDLNRATHAELELLPGIGPRLAQRILDARRERGQFGDVADLADVSGIGPAKLATLARLTCAGARCAAQRSNAQTNDSALTK